MKEKKKQTNDFKLIKFNIFSTNQRYVYDFLNVLDKMLNWITFQFQLFQNQFGMAKHPTASLKMTAFSWLRSYFYRFIAFNYYYFYLFFKKTEKFRFWLTFILSLKLAQIRIFNSVKCSCIEGKNVRFWFVQSSNFTDLCFSIIFKISFVFRKQIWEKIHKIYASDNL